MTTMTPAPGTVTGGINTVRHPGPNPKVTHEVDQILGAGHICHITYRSRRNCRASRSVGAWYVVASLVG